MQNSHIARQYLEHLEAGEIDDIIQLFSAEGTVDSPVYGKMPAAEFYRLLKDDTSQSELHLNAIYVNSEANDLAIYFTYTWTLKTRQKVVLDVVDIVQFDVHQKITHLKIIYDTVQTRALVQTLRSA